MLVNAQLLAEGWNSPRATVCMHLAPTASRRIYQQRVGRVTRRHPGKEAGIVVDFVHPATKHDDPVVTLHSLLDRDVYRGGAIVVGPVRRGRGRRLRVERRVLPVTADENRRIEVFERELWRIAVEHLDYGEQVQWAALAGARVAPTGWRRARAMLHFDAQGELKRTFLMTAVERNKNPQLRLRALQEIAASKDAEAFDRALDFVETWPRDDKREGVKVVLQALAEKKIGRRDQANNWIWRCANMTREVHEEYAVQRWPETKRLLGLLVNSSGGAHARNARRLVHAARQQDRRLAAALLAAALPHTAEAGEVVNGARTRMSRKPAALARELLRNFPKGPGKTKRRRKKKGAAGEAGAPEAVAAAAAGGDRRERTVDADPEAKPTRSRRRRRVAADADGGEAQAKPTRSRRSSRSKPATEEQPVADAGHRGRGRLRGDAEAHPRTPHPRGSGRRHGRVRGDAEATRARRTRAKAPESAESAPEADEAPKPARARRTRAVPAAGADESAETPKPATRRTRAKAPDSAEPAPEAAIAEAHAPAAPARSSRRHRRAADTPKPATRRTAPGRGTAEPPKPTGPPRAGEGRGQAEAGVPRPREEVGRAEPDAQRGQQPDRGRDRAGQGRRPRSRGRRSRLSSTAGESAPGGPRRRRA